MPTGGSYQSLSETPISFELQDVNPHVREEGDRDYTFMNILEAVVEVGEPVKPVTGDLIHWSLFAQVQTHVI